MDIEYYIIDPCGNITALVVSKTPKDKYKAASSFIMSKNTTVEQVGFVEYSEEGVTLNMSGDEFCGNATMSAAVLYLYKTGKSSGDISVRVLPMDTTVKVKTEKTAEGYFCEGAFDIVKDVKEYSFSANGREYTFPLVLMDGIGHIIADNSLGEPAAEEIIKSAAEKLSLPALGIMLYNSKTERLKPLVFVKETDTLFYENSCASGSISVAQVFCKEGKRLSLAEPGGIVRAAKSDGSIIISETIKINKKCLEEI